MVKIVPKLIVVRATVVSLMLLLLVACSAEQRYKRQVSGDETYLDAPALQALHVPAGMSLPLKNSAFDVPAGNLTGAVGKHLDIRPPVQPLALLEGSRAEYANGISQLLLENNAQNRNLWKQVVRAVQDNGVPIASRQNTEQILITDWLKWPRADEDIPFEGRYQISVQPQSYQLLLLVKSLGLQQAGKAVPDNAEIQRYNSTMLNHIISELDKQRTNSENNQVALNTGTLYVQSGNDDTGLPVLIVRTSYTTLWQRLPAALAKAGMRAGNSSRSQGTLKVSYKSPGNTSWDALGAKDPQLKEGNYTLQMGDLGNRSSVQFSDAKGHRITQTQNDALVAVFQAALNQLEIKAK